MTSESIFLAPGHFQSAPAILVAGTDPLGYVYGLLELAERVEHGADPDSALHLSEAVEEKPANGVRCVSRYFCSEISDKPWYYDQDFWRGYLDGLVAARFNRFCFAYGLEYDFPRGVTNDYFHLPYPYLVKVPGYENVRVVQLADEKGNRLPSPVQLSDEEREKNLAALKFIAAETGARGLHFQLGVWTHAYQWTDSPNAYHNIEGLTPETHAAYCRDALAMLLKECPEIQGVTMRVHGESGIPEGSWDFWKTLFEVFPKCGRTVEIDMHAKGVNQTMIDIGVATGMPIKLGAKYSAEHQSLGYNQSDIRALEIPKATRNAEQTPFSLSSGARSFTRYGYGDFFYEGSKAQVLYRLWPGTQRHLLSADPEMAAAYGRTSHFCGAAGIDLMEPLTFKGREGSGHAGSRCAYGDASLNPKYDFKNTSTTIASGVASSTTRTRRSKLQGAACVPHSASALSPLKPLLPTPAAFCRSSPRRTWCRLLITTGGLRSPPTCPLLELLQDGSFSTRLLRAVLKPSALSIRNCSPPWWSMCRIFSTAT